MMTMVMVSPQLKADEASCKKVLRDCDAAVTSLQQENSLQKQIIADQDKRYQAVASELKTESLYKPLAEGALVVVILESLILTLRK